MWQTFWGTESARYHSTSSACSTTPSTMLQTYYLSNFVCWWYNNRTQWQGTNQLLGRGRWRRGLTVSPVFCGAFCDSGDDSGGVLVLLRVLGHVVQGFGGFCRSDVRDGQLVNNHAVRITVWGEAKFTLKCQLMGLSLQWRGGKNKSPPNTGHKNPIKKWELKINWNQKAM